MKSPLVETASLDEIAEMYAEKVGKPDFINTFAAKGPIIIKEKDDSYLWCDIKTPGYPNKGLVGKLVLKGGNWRSKDQLSPMDVYRTELKEETSKKEGVDIPEGSDAKIQQILLDSVQPVFDYFVAVPRRILKNPNLPQKYYCDLSTLYLAEIDMDELFDLLKVTSVGDKLDKLKQALAKISTESDPAVVPFNELHNWKFGFGDDYKLNDILMVKYRQRIPLRYVKGVKVFRTQTDPTTKYADRQLQYLRKDNNPIDKDLSDRRVFEKRE